MPGGSARVSLGVPVYNGERFLRRTVESLLAQTFPDFELIVSDNASTDATEAIARELASRDRRVRYHRQPTNLGVAGNYNFLLDQARAPYFKWATADDPCEPRFLERCVEALDADPGAVLAYPRAQFIDDEGRPLDIEDPGFPLAGPPAERMRYVIGAGHWVNAILGLIRTDALRRTRKHGSYSGADYVMLGDLCLQGRFVEIPERLLLRRIHADASSQMVGDRERALRHITGRGGISLPTWSRLRDHARSVLGSDLDRRDKLSLIRFLVRQAIWRRERLGYELLGAARALGERRLGR
jgi:glycosyltransferase involved in cell wall biosynthesis